MIVPVGGEVYSVIEDVASLHRRPDNESPKETELLYGTDFQVNSIEGDWARGQEVSPVSTSQYPGYEGYLPVVSLDQKSEDATHIITSLCAPVFTSPDIKSPVIRMWPMNVRFKGIRENDFVNTSMGYVHCRHVRNISDARGETDFVSVAEQFLGRPYIWAGISSHGLDCSGLVQTALRAVDRDIPRDSCDQLSVGDEIDHPERLQRGDLIFWEGHVGIMQDDKCLLHANAFHMMVASEPLDVAIQRIQAGYGSVTARRRL